MRGLLINAQFVLRAFVFSKREVCGLVSKTLRLCFFSFFLYSEVIDVRVFDFPNVDIHARACGNETSTREESRRRRRRRSIPILLSDRTLFFGCTYIHQKRRGKSICVPSFLAIDSVEEKRSSGKKEKHLSFIFLCQWR